MRTKRKRKKKPDYYAVLGVDPTATQQEIKRAFRRLALKWHPDVARSKGSAHFLLINRAYVVLSDPVKRHRYDLFSRGDLVLILTPHGLAFLRRQSAEQPSDASPRMLDDGES